MLKPSTRWCWPAGPPEVRLPGGSLGALALALVTVDAAALSHARWGYVLTSSDLPPRQEDENAFRAMRKYQLTYQYENRAGIEADDQTAAPGPFVRVERRPARIRQPTSRTSRQGTCETPSGGYSIRPERRWMRSAEESVAGASRQGAVQEGAALPQSQRTSREPPREGTVRSSVAGWRSVVVQGDSQIDIHGMGRRPVDRSQPVFEEADHVGPARAAHLLECQGCLSVVDPAQTASPSLSTVGSVTSVCSASSCEPFGA